MEDKVMRKTSGLQAETIDELDVGYSQLGVQLRRQTDKRLLKKGGPWAALAFKFQDREGSGEMYGPEETMLAAFKSQGGTYKRYSYFIVRDKEMAEKIIGLLKECFDV